jgi:hypothetical protein
MVGDDEDVDVAMTSGYIIVQVVADHIIFSQGTIYC